MEDVKIIDLYFERNENAIRETKNKYGAFCYSLAYNILRDEEDSLECENDTYLALWKAIPPHRPRFFSAFIAKITRRISITLLRTKTAAKRSAEASLPFDELEDCICEKGEIYESMEAEELKNIIEKFLRSQSAEVRNIFLCRYFYAESIEDICKRFHCSQSKVKTTLHRTRKKLGQYLVKEGAFCE